MFLPILLKIVIVSLSFFSDVYSLDRAGLHKDALLYAHGCNSHKFEFFSESKTKNEKTFLFGDIES